MIAFYSIHMYIYYIYIYNIYTVYIHVHTCIYYLTIESVSPKGGNMVLPHPLILKFMLQNTVL